MDDITIDDFVLKGCISYSTSNYAQMLSSLEDVIISKGGGDRQTLDNTLRVSLNSVKLFIGAYNATLKKLQDLKQFPEGEQSAVQFSKVLSLYGASMSSLNYLDGNREVEIDQRSLQLTKSKVQNNINFCMDDYNLVAEIIEDLSKTIKRSYDLNMLKFDFIMYFANIADFSVKQSTKFEYKKHLFKVKNSTININSYEIPCLKEIISNKKTGKKNIVGGNDEDPNAMFKRPIEEYKFDPIKRDQIIANSILINKLEDHIDHMLLYDANLKRNPALDGDGLIQKVLISGPPGIGKTFYIQYLMSYAKDIFPGCFVTQFDFENPYKDGGKAALEHMINVVNQGDKPFIIFLDEIDTRFASRAGDAGFQSNQVLGEMLRWTGGSYVNRGNYMILATCNTPKNLDRALMRRFKEGLITLDAPTNPVDLAKMFYVHLKKGVDGGYVNIKNWEYLGHIAKEAGFYPSNIADISKIALNESKKERLPRQIFKTDYQSKLTILRNNHTIITDENIVQIAQEYVATHQKMSYQHDAFMESNIKGTDNINSQIKISSSVVR